MKYYFVSYAHKNGFGNTFFKSEDHLDIKKAEKQIVGFGKVSSATIITINEINKSQYPEDNIN